MQCASWVRLKIDVEKDIEDDVAREVQNLSRVRLERSWGKDGGEDWEGLGRTSALTDLDGFIGWAADQSFALQMKAADRPAVSHQGLHWPLSISPNVPHLINSIHQICFYWATGLQYIETITYFEHFGRSFLLKPWEKLVNQSGTTIHLIKTSVFFFFLIVESIFNYHYILAVFLSWFVKINKWYLQNSSSLIHQ